MIVLANATALVWFGKLHDEPFVYICLGVIAGHHIADVVAALKGGRT